VQLGKFLIKNSTDRSNETSVEMEGVLEDLLLNAR
jgi:hypothetical protein